MGSSPLCFVVRWILSEGMSSCPDELRMLRRTITRQTLGAKPRASLISKPLGSLLAIKSFRFRRLRPRGRDLFSPQPVAHTSPALHQHRFIPPELQRHGLLFIVRHPWVNTACDFGQCHGPRRTESQGIFVRVYTPILSLFLPPSRLQNKHS
jgi:hypothetical protein